MTEPKTKKLKTKKVACMICSRLALPEELVRLTVASSWKALYKAAKIRQFEPILKLACDHMTELPDIL